MQTLATRDGGLWIFSRQSRCTAQYDCGLNAGTPCARRVDAGPRNLQRMLCHERIDARLSDAEMLVVSGADIGDPHAFLRGLWAQVYDHAPMHLRSSVLRRLHALSRQLGVNYVHGEPDAAD
jgi:hypothetical protein